MKNKRKKNILYTKQKPFFDMTPGERVALFDFIKEQNANGVMVVLGLKRCALCGASLGAAIGGRREDGIEGDPENPLLIMNLCHECYTQEGLFLRKN